MAVPGFVEKSKEPDVLTLAFPIPPWKAKFVPPPLGTLSEPLAVPPKLPSTTNWPKRVPVLPAKKVPKFNVKDSLKEAREEASAEFTVEADRRSTPACAVAVEPALDGVAQDG